VEGASETAASARATRTTPSRFGSTEVARLLGVSEQRVRAIVRAGLCRPQRAGRRWQFTFQDLVVLRTAHGLLLARVPPRHLRRAMSQLVRQLPADRPLSGVRIVADGRRVVVRQGRTAWHPESGQVLFSFAVDELTRSARRVLAVGDKNGRQSTKPASKPLAAADWFERALEREQAGDLAGACAAYQHAIELDTAMGDAYINFGRLTHLLGDAAEAVRLYDLALACAPEDSVAHYNLAIALEDQGRTADALTHYRRAASLAPAFADVHYNLGRLLEQLGQPKQALRHLLQYKKLVE